LLIMGLGCCLRDPRVLLTCGRCCCSCSYGDGDHVVGPSRHDCRADEAHWWGTRTAADHLQGDSVLRSENGLRRLASWVGCMGSNSTRRKHTDRHVLKEGRKGGRKEGE